MSKEKAVEYIKRAMNSIDKLPFSDNGMLAIYDLERAQKELENMSLSSVLNTVVDYKKKVEYSLAKDTYPCFGGNMVLEMLENIYKQCLESKSI